MADEIINHPDGSATFSFQAWPGPAEAAEVGTSLAAMPVPAGIALYLGRVIIAASLLETAIKSLLRGLSAANGTTLDFQKLSKHGKLVTRLQSEAKLLPNMPSVTERITTAAEATREFHAKRGNIAHGEITLEIRRAGFTLVTVSRNGENKFTESELRDLALQMSAALFELTEALDPDDPSVQRSSLETQTLRDFLASNPHLAPKHPKPPPPPQSSEV